MPAFGKHFGQHFGLRKSKEICFLAHFATDKMATCGDCCCPPECQSEEGAKRRVPENQNSKGTRKMQITSARMGGFPRDLGRSFVKQSMKSMKFFA